MRGGEGGLREGKRKGEGADLGFMPDANLEAELRADRTANLAAMAAMAFRFRSSAARGLGF